jgi:hypothetical protein
MENCLVTKLKGVVDNPQLKVLGTIRIPIGNASNFTFYVTSVNANDCDITVKNNNGVIVGTFKSTATPTFFASSLPDGGYVEIANKYALTDFEFYNSGITPLNYQDFNRPTIDDVKYMTHLTKLSWATYDGSVEDIAHLPLASVNATYMTGDIAGFISRKVDAGNTNGDITPFSVYNNPNLSVKSTVKINGVVPYNGSDSDSSHPNTLHWEGKDKYFLLLGNHTLVYIHGYSDAEITSMRETGGVLEGVVNDDRVIKV